MRPDELERRLRERLDAFGPTPRAELLRVLMLTDFDQAKAIRFMQGPARRNPRIAPDSRSQGRCWPDSPRSRGWSGAASR